MGIVYCSLSVVQGVVRPSESLCAKMKNKYMGYIVEALQGTHMLQDRSAEVRMSVGFSM